MNAFFEAATALGLSKKKANQHVGTEAYQLPENKKRHQSAGHHQAKHREHEYRQAPKNRPRSGSSFMYP